MMSATLRITAETEMNELARTLIANGIGAPPAHVLEALDEETVHRRLPGVPHSIYEEVWHLAFWQQLSLDWIGGKPTPYPEHASDGFPTSSEEAWSSLRDRFLRGAAQAADIAGDPGQLESFILCLSREAETPRNMQAREQLEGIAAHNAYHLGRIVLLRQLFGAWPPPSGGDTW
jgi:uncharacterized damage-inducible protein DinB